MKMRLIYAPADDEYVEQFGVVPELFDILSERFYERRTYDDNYYSTMHEMQRYAIHFCNGSGVGGHYWFFTEKDRLAFIMRYM